MLGAESGIGRAKSGRVECLGEDISRLSSASIVGRGVSHCPEGGRIFANMTVKENLELGAYLRSDKQGIADDYDRALTFFPRLRECLAQSAGTSLFAEQQMLAIGRSLMSRTMLLMLDELSIGLALILVKELFRIIATINVESCTSFSVVYQTAY